MQMDKTTKRKTLSTVTLTCIKSVAKYTICLLITKAVVGKWGFWLIDLGNFQNLDNFHF